MGLHRQAKSQWCSPPERVSCDQCTFPYEWTYNPLFGDDGKWHRVPYNLLSALSWDEQGIVGLWALQWWQMVPCDLVFQSDLNQRTFVFRDLPNFMALTRNYWESQFSAQLKYHHLVYCSPCMCQVIGSWSLGFSLYPWYFHLISVDMPIFFFLQESCSYKRWCHLPKKETDSLPAVPPGSRQFMPLWPSEYLLHPSSSTLLVWLIDQPGSDKGRKKKRGQWRAIKTEQSVRRGDSI